MVGFNGVIWKKKLRDLWDVFFQETVPNKLNFVYPDIFIVHRYWDKMQERFTDLLPRSFSSTKKFS